MIDGNNDISGSWCLSIFQFLFMCLMKTMFKINKKEEKKNYLDMYQRSCLQAYAPPPITQGMSGVMVKCKIIFT